MHDDDFDLDIGIDLTPLIDVIFMLLIFFIMTTTFARPVIDIVLPASNTAEPPARSGPELLISVDGQGRIFHGADEMDEAALAAFLDGKEDELLNLYVDREAPFESFVRVVDVARARYGGRFVISTQPGATRDETPVGP